MCRDADTDQSAKVVPKGTCPAGRVPSMCPSSNAPGDESSGTESGEKNTLSDVYIVKVEDGCCS